MNIIKNLKNRFVKWFIYGARRSSETYIKYLKKQGVVLGEGTVFYEPYTNTVDMQNPKLIRIGNNVRITSGVVILTHDYSWSVLAGKYGACTGAVAPVFIGNNVFIGMNTIITRGVNVGDNVIIGAGSIVTRDCESNSVYAGNPAKRICSLEDFYKRRMNESINDAKRIVVCLEEQSISEIESYLREYACLFSNSSKQKLDKLYKDTGYYDKCINFYNDYEYPFSSIDEFVKQVRK